MAYTLTKSDGTPVITFTTNGALTNEDNRKDATLQEYPFIGQDSNKLQVGDWGGTKRTITVEGFRIDTPANLTTFSAIIDSLIGGLQMTVNKYPFIYTSTRLGTKNVKFLSVNSVYTKGRARALYYTIRMIECDPLV